MAVYWFYLLKVNICVAIFYLFYVSALRNFTYFMLNRLYLVFGLLISFIIPVLNFSIFKSHSNNMLLNIIHPVLIEPDDDFFQYQNLSNHVHTINLLQILSIIYFIGLSILFLKLSFSIVRIIKKIKNSEIHQFGKKKIVIIDSNVPFSFFNLIFLPKYEHNSMIIEHELAHVRHFHWIDLVLSEITFLVLWFNPIIFLYKRALKLQHEYFADFSVTKINNRIEPYLNCMLTRIQVISSGGLISQFHSKTIKNRIIMITKNKTSSRFLGVYLLILPLVCVMLFAFTSGKTVLHNNDKIVATSSDFKPSIYPVNMQKARISSDYGERIDPFTRKRDFHHGIDFAIPPNDKIVSTANGIVIDTKFDPEKGNYILIKHNGIYSTFYSHLKSVSVKVGDNVKKGQVIGYSGNTGSHTTGPHLHYEVHKNGKAVNPKNYLPR